MALWEAGGRPLLETLPPNTVPSPPPPYDPYFVGGKRRVSCSEGSDCNAGWLLIYKRPRHANISSLSLPSSGGVLTRPSTPVESTPAPARAFFVRSCQPSPASASGYLDPDREDYEFSDPEPEIENEPYPAFDYAAEHNCFPNASSLAGSVTGVGGCSMERTASGLSISSGTTHASSTREQQELGLLGDLEASQLVRDHVANFVRRSRNNSRHERVLRTLINPKNREAEFPIDEAALESIFSAANAIFFASRLSNRVTWDWSHESAPQYQSSVIGTTALRRCRKLGGYETLIVLSRPILMSSNFSRRLLISTFLHELIHSYLFVSCGFKAKESGGHTEGFHQIAAVIDRWAGPEHLRLREMEADLESYRAEPEGTQERDVYLRGQGSQFQCEQAQWVSSSGIERDGRVLRSTRYPDDSHLPILRLQPHRLLQSRSQTGLHRQYDNQRHHHHAHHIHNHHSHPIHHEAKFDHHRRSDDWDEWIDDRWHGRPQAKFSISSSTPIQFPVSVPVSVPVTVPIRTLNLGGPEEGGVYVGYGA